MDYNTLITFTTKFISIVCLLLVVITNGFATHFIIDMVKEKDKKKFGDYFIMIIIPLLLILLDFMTVLGVCIYIADGCTFK